MNIEIEVTQFYVANFCVPREHSQNRFFRSCYSAAQEPLLMRSHLMHQSAKYGEMVDAGDQYSKGIWFIRSPGDSSHYSDLPEIPFLPDLPEDEYFQLSLVYDYKLPIDMILAIQKKHVELTSKWSDNTSQKIYLEY